MDHNYWFYRRRMISTTGATISTQLLFRITRQGSSSPESASTSMDMEQVESLAMAMRGTTPKRQSLNQEDRCHLSSGTPRMSSLSTVSPIKPISYNIYVQNVLENPPFII